jgi:hypothetical protein
MNSYQRKSIFKWSLLFTLKGQGQEITLNLLQLSSEPMDSHPRGKPVSPRLQVRRRKSQEAIAGCQARWF